MMVYLGDTEHGNRGPTLEGLNLVLYTEMTPEVSAKKSRRQSGTDAQHVTWRQTEE